MYAYMDTLLKLATMLGRLQAVYNWCGLGCLVVRVVTGLQLLDCKQSVELLEKPEGYLLPDVSMWLLHKS